MHLNFAKDPSSAGYNPFIFKRYGESNALDDAHGAGVYDGRLHMNLSTISIRRPWKYNYGARQFSVFIDEMKVGGVKNGGEARFEIRPGRHSIYIQVDFYKSEPCVIDLQPDESASLVCGAKEGVSGLVSAFISHNDYLFLRPDESSVQVIASTEYAHQTARQEQVAIHMESEEERVPAVTEEVYVPKGVKIKVKRSRTVEHTVEVDWAVVGEARIEAGIKQIMSGSIRSEISQKQGLSATESETVEYEVEIDGENFCRYQLKWTDIWRNGVAEFMHSGTTRVAPFRYRERSELEVVPLTDIS